MQAKAGVTAIAIVAMLGLAACGDRSEPPELMNLKATEGPDEFGILPPKPLELPKSLAELPEPTPGGANRTDPRPMDDAAIALGGTGQSSTGGGVPAADGALYAHTARFGTQDNIRAQLASEDLQWRRDNNGRVLERLMNVNVYFKAYKKFWLDQHGELAAWRARGVRTPSAPPANASEK
ncbi:DUF3035 domain-containing protein [Xinfangfangia sp. CPCC 101601]|uniref:DUF3035 domain-containing protein n=1 Tax=Pseudogemmobacter lacusdianii TaxID=3069608 RepID=A0ABU0VWY2_9RHOB|nr:DUF3035 domain-containing protein [Xinfangfangia sp. CPCC 101601]MDQ2066252.1 DUF3035 domain-containing protein [Xinfangfangia sp. CPCC 101601]